MNPRSYVVESIIIGLGLIASAAVAAYAFYAVHTLGNTLSVTGSATQSVQADSAKWTVSVTRSAYADSIASTQTKVAADSQQVQDFFTSNGIDKENITTSPIFADQDYSKNQNSGPTAYNVREDITVQSKDPQLVQKLSKDISQLAGKGILVSSQMPQYYVSTLPDIRIALIGKAVTDAKARATEIAKSTGQKVGALQSASGGVVQVLSPNSGDVSDYGSYDTSTIDKQVMVTARATFYIR